MNERTETIICCCMLVIIALLAYGIATMADWNSHQGIKYNGDPEGWNWNINQTNGTIPVQHTSLTIYQESIESVESITVNGKQIEILNLTNYHIQTQLNGSDVSIYDVMMGMYGAVIIETDRQRYDVVVSGDDIVLVVKE